MRVAGVDLFVFELAEEKEMKGMKEPDELLSKTKSSQLLSEPMVSWAYFESFSGYVASYVAIIIHNKRHELAIAS